MTFNTLKDAEDFFAATIRAQSMILAAVVRPMIADGSLSESDLRESLNSTERAALERRTPETSALTGLVELLRADLGLS